MDHFSKFTWLFPIKLKFDIMNVFKVFQLHVERLFDRKIKAIQTNWGGEYRSLHNYFSSLGILHRLSCPHTHKQNGTVERKHRHLVETGLSLLAKASIPQCY